MTGISTIAKPLTDQINDARNKNNILKLLNKIGSIGTTKIGALGDLAESRAFRRVLKNPILSVDLINKSLLKSINVNPENRILVPLDGTEIRKPNTNKSEDLDRVRSLDGKIVNGYHTLTAIGIEQEEQKRIKNIHFLPIETYSCKAEDFKSKNVFFESLVDKISTLPNPVTFIMDREYDSIELLKHIVKTPDNRFIVRVSHLKRLVLHQGLETKIDTIDGYQNSTKILDTLQIKNKTYTDLMAQLAWTEIEIDGIKMTVIKTTLVHRGSKKPLFQKPLYLLTNQLFLDSNAVYEIYLNYFLRWKIETVFKFMKQTLGLEDFAVQDFKSISNLIALTFLVGAYYYKLGKGDLTEEFLIKLSDLGGGKGKLKGKKYSLFYIQNGIRNLLIHQQTQAFFRENDIGEAEQAELMEMVDVNLW
jgi:Transposase DDE domain